MTKIVTTNIPLLQFTGTLVIPENYPLNGLSPEQLSLLSELKESLKSETFTKEQELWLDDACLLRYLRASKFSLKLAQEKLNATLKWRQEFKPWHMDKEDLDQEAVGESLD